RGARGRSAEVPVGRGGGPRGPRRRGRAGRGRRASGDVGGRAEHARGRGFDGRVDGHRRRGRARPRCAGREEERCAGSEERSAMTTTPSPAPPTPAEVIDLVAVSFGRLLRAREVAISPAEVIEVRTVLALVGARDPGTLRAALRAVTVKYRREDRAFDAVFDH